MKFALVLISFVISSCFGSPVPQDEKEEKPMPYAFNWEVNEREAKTDGAFFTHTEEKKEDAPTRTEGEYKVWLPDGRLMVVSYYVDGESGFVPTITFEDGYTPEWKEK